MIRFPLPMAMLALCLVALQCTASKPDHSDQGDTLENGGAGGGGSGGGGPQDKPASTAITQAVDAQQQEEEQAVSLTVTTTTTDNKAPNTSSGIDNGFPGVGTEKSGHEGSSTSSSSSSVANKTAAAAGPASSPGVVGDTQSAPSITAPAAPSGLPTDHTLDNSHTAQKHAVTTDANEKRLGAASTTGSNNKTPKVGSEAHNTLSPSPHSSAGNGGSLTQSGLARDTGDHLTDSSSDKLRHQNKDQLQDNAGNQAKNNASQTQGNTGSLPTSSELTGANKPKQEQNVSPASKPQKQTEEDTSTSEDVHQKGDITNNNKQQTGGQGNAGTPTDPKTVSNVPSNKGATKTPKREPSLTTGTESKMNSTTTTTMAEDPQPKSDAHETSKTPTSTLAKQSKTLEQLQTLDTKDGISSTSLIFAFATLVTFALVSVISVS